MLVSRRKAEKILNLTKTQIMEKIGKGEVKATKVGHNYQVEVTDLKPAEVMKTYTCDICGAGPFTRSIEKATHVKTTHPKEKVVVVNTEFVNQTIYDVV